MKTRDDDRTPPGTPEAPVSTMEDLRREVRQFRPVDILVRCRSLSLALADHRGVVELDIPPEIDQFSRQRRIRVAPYSVALIARLSLMEGSRLAIGNLDELRFKRLLRIVSELDDPSLSGWPLLLRTWDEQSWYQRDFKHAVGRGLTWYCLIPAALESPEIDLPHEFETHVGLSVDDFFATVFLVFAIGSSPDATPYQHLSTMLAASDLSDRGRELLASDRVSEFLLNWQIN